MNDPRTAGRLNDAPLRAGAASLPMLAYAVHHAPSDQDARELARRAFGSAHADRFTVALANGYKVELPPLD